MGYRSFFKDKNVNVYVVIAFLSAVVFLSIYGVKVLNPTYTDWLLMGGDLSQHYLGWTAFRASSWHFPIGMVDTLAYPHQTSIIFTDSIPLLAIAFKILSPILPKNFQYFGFWGIVCFILQGILAARIIKNFTESKVIVIISSMLFIFTPAMIWRMYIHTALAGHWILLLGLETIFAHKKYQSNKKIYFIVGLMGVLSGSIHIYFVLMSGIILLGICFTDITVYRRINRSGIILAEYLTLAVTVVWLLGGMSSGMQAQDNGLGVFSSNLNTLFNPQGWSRIYRDLPLYGSGQYEGSGYLGGGCIFLFLLAVICLTNEKIHVGLKRHWKESLAIIFVLSVSMLIALSPVITMGDQVIWQMQLPQWIINKLSIFRASGRIVWPVIYIIMLGSCVVALKVVDRRMMVVALSMALLIQMYDISDILREKYEYFSNTQKYVSMLTETDFWSYIAQRNDIKHIVYYSTVELPMMYSITDWAMQNGKTVSNFYFARSIDDQIADSKKDAFSTLPDDTLFIFTQGSFMTSWYNLHYYQKDGLIIGYRDKIPGYEEILNGAAFMWNFGENLYLSEDGGIDTEDGRLIYPGGLSYGPYWSVRKGKYVITISGESMLEEVDIAVYSQFGDKHYDIEMLSRNAAEIRLGIYLDEDTDSLEIVVHNKGENTVLIKNMEMR